MKIGLLIFIIILAVLIGSFLFGGGYKPGDKVGPITEEVAIQACQNRCDQALLLPTDELKTQSAFCTLPLENIDMDGDGE